MAWVRSSPRSSTCHSRAPPGAGRGDVAVVGRGPAEAAQEVGLQQVLRRGRRHSLLTRPCPARAAASRAAAAGSRSAQRATGGGPSLGRRAAGRSPGSSRRCRLDGRAPVRREPALGAPAEHRHARPGPRRGRRGGGGVDDRGVGQHPAGSDVALGGEAVAGLPQRPHGGERARLADLVDARTCGATARPAARADRRCGRPRTPACAHSSLPCSASRPGQHVAQLDEHLDVERRVDEPVVGQRAARPVGGAVALLQRQPEQLLDQRPEADAGEPGEPAGQLGVEQPRGRQPDLGQAGQVLVRGVQHPLRPGSAGASADRSLPSGIGSTSAVPAPARRSCTR